VSGRRDVFVPDRGLQVRMAVALALNGALLAALLLVAVWLVVAVDGGWSFVLIFVLLAGAGAAPVGYHDVRRDRRRVTQRDEPQAAGIVSRLSVVADLPPPDVRVEPDSVPLSWTTAVPGRRARIRVTTGLLDRLSAEEFEAVLAHELSHVAHRDAVLMTVLAMPGVFVLRGLRDTWHEPLHYGKLRASAGLVMFGALMGPPAIVSALLSRIVSRHRELAADRGAALLTGSPAALASALMKLSQELAGQPKADLRAVAARDVLHVVPAHPGATRGVRRLWATHPPLAARLRQLEQLESRLQAG
jgi:heat shock protein HtpX